MAHTFFYLLPEKILLSGLHCIKRLLFWWNVLFFAGKCDVHFWNILEIHFEIWKIVEFPCLPFFGSSPWQTVVNRCARHVLKVVYNSGSLVSNKYIVWRGMRESQRPIKDGRSESRRRRKARFWHIPRGGTAKSRSGYCISTISPNETMYFPRSCVEFRIIFTTNGIPTTWSSE